jgi:hypothetical protein
LALCVANLVLSRLEVAMHTVELSLAVMIQVAHL